MKPSSHSSSVIVDSNNPRVIETITLTAGDEGIEAKISLLLAIMQTIFGDVKLGSVLFQSQILPCVLSSVYSLQFSQLLLVGNDLIPPSLDNFISEEIDNVITTATEAAFLMYEPSMKKALPNFFHLKMRKILNNFLTKYMSKTANTDCPAPVLRENEYVNFKLLLGSKTDETNFTKNPYGTMPSMLLDIMDKQMISPGADWSPKINNMLIRPLSLANSNISGTMLFDKKL